MIKLRINPLPSTTHHLPATNRGFTIVELIIVITIMGILLTLGVVNLRSSQANGRDAERKVDVDTIALHLETYYTSGIDGTATPFSATGGTITTSGGYTIHTFTSNGTLTVTGGTISGAQVLVVGGGGGAGGGTVNAYGVGGGGAGGVVSDTANLSSTMSVTVGASGVGGAPGNNYGANGGNSVFGSYTAIGGGGGAGNDNANAYTGNSGGSGGGGSRLAGLGGSGTSAQGFAGGHGADGGPLYGGGGGGGDGGSGGDGLGSTLGVAGIGVAYSITGSSVTYAAGGRGGGYSTSVNGVDASPNTGNGGNGGTTGSFATLGGAGGAGIVIIRYLTPTTTTATHTATYPSTALTATTASIIQYLRDIDTKSITAPGITDPTLTFIPATNNTQTTAGVLPQPTINQYVYQPLHSDGSLCSDTAECRKFNLYYRSEVDNNVYMVSSVNQ